MQNDGGKSRAIFILFYKIIGIFHFAGQDIYIRFAAGPRPCHTFFYIFFAGRSNNWGCACFYTFFQFGMFRRGGLSPPVFGTSGRPSPTGLKEDLNKKRKPRAVFFLHFAFGNKNGRAQRPSPTIYSLFALCITFCATISGASS